MMQNKWVVPLVKYAMNSRSITNYEQQNQEISIGKQDTSRRSSA